MGRKRLSEQLSELVEGWGKEAIGQLELREVQRVLLVDHSAHRERKGALTAPWLYSILRHVFTPATLLHTEAVGELTSWNPPLGNTYSCL
jgi:hypothetical protein